MSQQAGALRVVVEIAIGSLLIAAVIALAWPQMAPAVYAEVTESGARMSPVEVRRQFGIEVWFGVLCASAGVLLGALGFHRHRHRPVTTLLTLVAGGAAGAFLAWQLGRQLGPADLDERAEGAAVGTLLELPLDLQAYPMLMVWPVIAAIAAVSVAAILDDVTPWRSGSRPPGRAGA